METFDDGKASEGVKDETLNELCTRVSSNPTPGSQESILFVISGNWKREKMIIYYRESFLKQLPIDSHIFWGDPALLCTVSIFDRRGRYI